MMLDVITNTVKSVRPTHWSKNLLLFAGLIFSRNILTVNLVLKTIGAFWIFCALAGGIYLINDIIDLKKDRQHPFKRQRPIAAGKLNVTQALKLAVLLLTLGSGFAYLLNTNFAIVCHGYVGLMVMYSLYLKKFAVIDVLVVAIGFVLRAVAGVMVIKVHISPGLLVCILFLSLVLVLSKRRQEIMLLGDKANQHRDSFEGYNLRFLNRLIGIATAATLSAYVLCIITLHPQTRVENYRLFVTTPFVIYGIFRYLKLVYRDNRGNNPESLVFSDRLLLIDISLWLAVVFLVLYL